MVAMITQQNRSLIFEMTGTLIVFGQIQGAVK
ncbi:hypothetical protein Brsp05_04061 [Brucella sp. NBRC 12953]